MRPRDVSVCVACPRSTTWWTWGVKWEFHDCIYVLCRVHLGVSFISCSYRGHVWKHGLGLPTLTSFPLWVLGRGRFLNGQLWEDPGIVCTVEPNNVWSWQSHRLVLLLFEDFLRVFRNRKWIPQEGGKRWEGWQMHTSAQLILILRLPCNILYILEEWPVLHFLLSLLSSKWFPESIIGGNIKNFPQPAFTYSELSSAVLLKKQTSESKNCIGLWTHTLIYNSKILNLLKYFTQFRFRQENEDWHICISLPIVSLFCRTRLRSHSREHSFLPGCQVSVCSGAGVQRVATSHLRRNALEETDWANGTNRPSMERPFGKKRVVSTGCLFHWTTLLQYRGRWLQRQLHSQMCWPIVSKGESGWPRVEVKEKKMLDARISLSEMFIQMSG